MVTIHNTPGDSRLQPPLPCLVRLDLFEVCAHRTKYLPSTIPSSFSCDCDVLALDIHGKTEDAAFNPVTPQDLQHPRTNTDSNNSYNTQLTRERGKIQKPACVEGHPVQPGMTSRTYHTKPDPKSMRVVVLLCLWGVKAILE